MAFFIDDSGMKHNISNFNNMEMRCTCDFKYYTYFKNPIRIGLRSGATPMVYRSSDGAAYDETVQQGRAISFCGCICELDRISKNYKIYGALNPTQYNWHPTEVDKETGKCKGAITDFKIIHRWSK